MSYSDCDLHHLIDIIAITLFQRCFSSNVQYQSIVSIKIEVIKERVVFRQRIQRQVTKEQVGPRQLDGG